MFILHLFTHTLFIYMFSIIYESGAVEKVSIKEKCRGISTENVWSTFLVNSRKCVTIEDKTIVSRNYNI